MKVYPFDKVIAKCEEVMASGWDIHQQFNCAHCGVKQTMETPNQLYTSGQCEECGEVTDLRAAGCNFMATHGVERPSSAH